MEWFRRSETARLRGAALVLHGLNLDPACMAAVISVLNVGGIDALRLSLRGHGGNFRQRQGMDATQSRLEDFKGVSHSLWFLETLEGFEEARKYAHENRVPLFLVGFSYGALIGLDLLAARPEVAFDRALLFAPSLSLRGWNNAIRLFAPFPKMIIPTLAPARYLANPGTPMVAYNALFETLDHFESHIGSRLNIPTLVIMDPGDELVSLGGIEELARTHHLDQWRFHPVHHQGSLRNRTPRHIVIDEMSVGRKAWVEIRTAMEAHLR